MLILKQKWVDGWVGGCVAGWRISSGKHTHHSAQKGRYFQRLPSNNSKPHHFLLTPLQHIIWALWTRESPQGHTSLHTLLVLGGFMEETPICPAEDMILPLGCNPDVSPHHGFAPSTVSRSRRRTRLCCPQEEWMARTWEEEPDSGMGSALQRKNSPEPSNRKGFLSLFNF